MNILSEYKSKKQRWLYHITFWIFILIYQVSRYQMNFRGYTIETFKKNFLEEAVFLIVLIPASYFTTYYLIPKLYMKKKYTQFTVLLLISISVFVLFLRCLSYFILLPWLYPIFFKSFPRFLDFNAIQHSFYIYSVVITFVMIKMLRQFYQTMQQKERLKKQNIESELALLRNQVNPHFLFNTLNNINSLVFKNPNLTYKSIIKLSDIMRYMLQDSNIPYVTLEKEIEYLKSYIGLQQLRLEEPDFVKFSIHGNYNNRDIAPMLFIAFVENAFKYCEKDVKAPGIEIDLSVGDNSISFEVKNFKKKILSPDLSNSSGIGINNVKRRLNLLYPENYDLKIISTNEYYQIKLNINISNNEN